MVMTPDCTDCKAHARMLPVRRSRVTMPALLAHPERPQVTAASASLVQMACSRHSPAKAAAANAKLDRPQAVMAHAARV